VKIGEIRVTTALTHEFSCEKLFHLKLPLYSGPNDLQKVYCSY